MVLGNLTVGPRATPSREKRAVGVATLAGIARARYKSSEARLCTKRQHRPAPHQKCEKEAYGLAHVTGTYFQPSSPFALGEIGC